VTLPKKAAPAVGDSDVC